MKLYTSSETPLVGATLVCRQGRLAGTIGCLVMAAIFGGAPVFWHAVGAPWFLWVPFALLAVLLVPMLVGDIFARWRSSNWLLAIRPDGVWIHFRSYQDRAEPEALTVVHFSYAEIAAVRQHVQTFSVPRGDRVHFTQHKLKCLDLCLAQGDTEELRTALSANLNRAPHERVYLGGLRVSTRASHFPVSLPTPDVVRLAWRGGQGHWAAPSLKRVLAELEQRVAVNEPVRHDRSDWDQLSDAELDEQILLLVESGDRLDAIQLLVQRRGYTTTAAHRFVDELVCRI